MNGEKYNDDMLAQDYLSGMTRVADVLNYCATPREIKMPAIVPAQVKARFVNNNKVTLRSTRK